MKSDVQSGVDLLTANLRSGGFEIERQSSEEVLFKLPVEMADGRVVAHRILVRGNGAVLKAGEDPVDGLLPRFCPDRHIFGDGDFCMSWDLDQRFDVVDLEGARRWLGLLIQFLRTQHRAAYKRTWPNSEQWGHGEPVAIAQREAERVGAMVGGEWLEWILERQLETVKTPERVYRVLRNGELLLSVWQSPNRGVKHRRRIMCLGGAARKGRQVIRDMGRARLLLLLASALWDWQYSEECFWRLCADKPCCGTMDTCGLRRV